ncbi:class I SAM-dependent methyltransferase [Lysobacter sp. K5869]|uniref:class I SAM-dependent methyltransferase n=1 Tax=Lysobacter sp. K5869 TaxID=2820808 RepID=UPI001C061C6D|nr:class I SAM-dependent methyltransferase [Lysobacter sp. K5869]QWP76238.1 class I SAM-dependent methyltransferase [Lysobacter sp. K5869]
MSDALRSLLDELDADAQWRHPRRWRERAQLQDRIERLSLRLGADDAALRERAEAAQARLDAADAESAHALRARIRAGEGAQVLREWRSESPPQADGEGYDPFDAMLAAVLDLAEPQGEIAAPAPQTVFYQPTPARHLLDLLARLGLRADDVLIDLGSGLGHVPLLAAACTPARCIGIEHEAAYVASANDCARALGLARAEFAHADARTADLSAGTVFYLYTPFTGDLLAQVLERLRALSARRPLRIASLGPCTPALAAQPWLRARDAECVADRIAVFDAGAV